MSHKLYFWGKLLYVIPLGLTGLIYILSPQASVETLTSFIPGELMLIYAAGICWVLFSIGFIFKIQPKISLIGLLSLLTAYLIMVHIPAAYTGESLTLVWIELLQDVSLIGGALIMFAILEDPKKTTCRYIKKFYGY